MFASIVHLSSQDYARIYMLYVSLTPDDLKILRFTGNKVILI